MVTQLGQFTKLGLFSTFQLFELSQLCYYLLYSFENEMITLYLSCHPCHRVLQASFGLHSTTAANNGVSGHVIQKQMRVGTVKTVRRYSSLNLETLKTTSSALFK